MGVCTSAAPKGFLAVSCLLSHSKAAPVGAKEDLVCAIGHDFQNAMILSLDRLGNIMKMWDISYLFYYLKNFCL